MSLLGAQRVIEKARKASATFSQIPVGVAATLLSVRNDQRSDVAIINSSAVTVFIGPSTVTIATGAPLPASSGVGFDSFTGALYGIVAAGAAVVGVIEV
jgi:hypothetical protein